MNPLVLVVDNEPDVEVLFRSSSGATFAPTASQWSLRNPPPWSARPISGLVGQNDRIAHEIKNPLTNLPEVVHRRRPDPRPECVPSHPGSPGHRIVVKLNPSFSVSPGEMRARARASWALTGRAGT